MNCSAANWMRKVGLVALTSLIAIPVGLAGDNHSVIAKSSGGKTIAVKQVGERSYLLLAEYERPKERSILQVYRLRTEGTRSNTVWTSSVLGIKASAGGTGSLVDSKWGYFFSGQGAGEAKHSAAVVLMDKGTGRIFWRHWISPTAGYARFEVGSVFASDKELMVVGSDQRLTENGGKTIVTETHPVLIKFDPTTGKTAHVGLEVQGSAVWVPRAIAGDAAGENMIVAGFDMEGEKHPFAVKVKRDGKTEWAADFMGTSGSIDGAAWIDSRFVLWGEINEVSVMKVFELNGVEQTTTISSFTIRSVSPGEGKGAYLLAGYANRADGPAKTVAKVVKILEGKTPEEKSYQYEGNGNYAGEFAAAFTLPNYALLTFGSTVTDESTPPTNDLWVMYQSLHPSICEAPILRFQKSKIVEDNPFVTNKFNDSKTISQIEFREQGGFWYSRDNNNGTVYVRIEDKWYEVGK